jgi:glycosyltransferase involved in cell wall biosynthesis
MDVPVHLRIVHVLRAPVGGVFRHVTDLAEAQTAAGHAVGIVCDALTGSRFEEEVIAAVGAKIALGVARIAMHRSVSPADLPSMLRVLRKVQTLTPDVIHCHGAKGGIYGRLAGGVLRRRRPVAVLYSPHGGSLFYPSASLEGRFYFVTERLMERFTDAIIHVSGYEAEVYRQKVGVPRCRARVIPNGLRDDEFEPVIPRADARDLVFLGRYRNVKGTDVLLKAIARIERTTGYRASAHLFGQIEDDSFPRYQALAASLGIADRVTFHDAATARAAFSHGRVVVVPSRAESMPYVVLESIAAGMPIVATNVGGIPEIFGPHAGELVPPDDPDALAVALQAQLADPVRAQLDAAARLDWIRPRFSIAAMQHQIMQLYREILACEPHAGRLVAPLRAVPARTADSP